MRQHDSLFFFVVFSRSFCMLKATLEAPIVRQKTDVSCSSCTHHLHPDSFIHEQDVSWQRWQHVAYCSVVIVKSTPSSGLAVRPACCLRYPWDETSAGKNYPGLRFVDSSCAYTITSGWITTMTIIVLISTVDCDRLYFCVFEYPPIALVRFFVSPINSGIENSDAFTGFF